MTVFGRPALLITTCTLFCAGAAASAAQEGATSPPVTRVRGVIQEDQTWSGTVIVTDDVTIDGATVTVRAGTIVEFADSHERHAPTLAVGGWNERFGGYLKILGEADKPVIFRTREGTNPGHMIVNVRSETTSVPFQPGDAKEKPPPPKEVPGRVNWKHVRFEGLGDLESRQMMNKEVMVARPSVTFKAVGGPHTLSLAHCTFDHSTRLCISAADGCRIDLHDNQFTNETERVALEIGGILGQAPPEVASVSRNTLSSAIDLALLPVHLTDNVVIGVNAAVAVNASPGSDVRVRGNYVHNTSEDDDGRYCLNCEYADARIENNVFRGGSMCVLNGSRTMTGNVIIGAPRLENKISRSSKTHRLVASLPRGSKFERNLLLGPAFSLLAPQPRLIPRRGEDKPSSPGEPTTIRNNLLDGLGASKRAIHLGAAGLESQPIRILDNVFLRTDTVVFIEEDSSGQAMEFGKNAAAPPPARVIDRAGARDAGGGSSLSVVVNDLPSLHLVAIPPERIPDFASDVQSGKVTTEMLRTKLFEMYRPRAESPLIVHTDGGVSTLGPGAESHP